MNPQIGCACPEDQLKFIAEESGVAALLWYDWFLIRVYHWFQLLADYQQNFSVVGEPVQSLLVTLVNKKLNVSYKVLR